MNILLVNPSCPQTIFSFEKILSMLNKKALLPPLGLVTIAALLPHSWNLKLVDNDVREISADEWNWCDCIFITGMIVQIDGILRTLREGKYRNKMVVVGGPYAYHFPEYVLNEGADIVVRGEAENIISSLVNAIRDQMSGIILQADKKPDLVESPVPQYDLLDLSQYVDMAFQFSRGCPFNCEFCDITLMHGKKVRTKRPYQILHELQCLYEAGWRRSIFIVDDNFIGDSSKARDLLENLIPWMEKRKYPFDFYTQVSVNLASKPELLHLMCRAGFHRVFLGIETDDRQALKNAHKYQNLSLDLGKACQTITRAGLQIVAGFIVGIDHEKRNADQRIIDFATRNSIPESFASLLHAFPGSRLWERLEGEGRLLPYKCNESMGMQTSMVNFVPTRDVREIVEEFINIYDVLYQPESYLERLYGHFRNMKTRHVKKGFFPPYIPELKAVAHTLFKLGVLSPCRWKFWKYLVMALLKFPRRLRYYVASCVFAGHFFEYRETIQSQLRVELTRDAHLYEQHAKSQPVRQQS